MPENEKSKDHCGSHSERNNWISSIEEEMKVIGSDVTTIKAQRNTGLYVMGGFCSLVTVIGLLVIYIFNSNVSGITIKLDKIENFVSSASAGDAEIKGRLQNLEWRIQTLESRK